MINKFKKWLSRNEKRHYEIAYIATGFMGNKYDAAIIEFDVSDEELKIRGFNASQYGFHINYELLSRHFNKDSNGLTAYVSADINLDKE